EGVADQELDSRASCCPPNELVLVRRREAGQSDVEPGVQRVGSVRKGGEKSIGALRAGGARREMNVAVGATPAGRDERDPPPRGGAQRPAPEPPRPQIVRRLLDPGRSEELAPREKLGANSVGELEEVVGAGERRRTRLERRLGHRSALGP